MIEMTREELEVIIRSKGWIPIPRPRRRGNIYYYASRREGKKMKEVYIAPESKLGDITEEQVLAKLA